MESRAENDPLAGEGNGAAKPEAPGQHNSHASPQDALRDAFARLAEAREFLAYLIQVKTDSLKTAGRSLLLYAVAGILGMALGAAFVATAAVLLLLGVAHGLGELFHHDWIGEIVVSAVVLAVIAGGIMFGLKWLPRIMRKQLVSKYEARQRKQRSEFGRDVTQQARAVRDRAASHPN